MSSDKYPEIQMRIRQVDILISVWAENPAVLCQTDKQNYVLISSAL